VYVCVTLRSTPQETTILRSQSVRPGQLFVFFERVTVAKLAVSRADDDDPDDAAGGTAAGRRRRHHLLVPLTHAGRFRRTRDAVVQQLTLTALSRSPLGYPFTLTYHDETQYRNLEDDLLPANSPLRADGIVDDDCVLAARISDEDSATAACDATQRNSAATHVYADEAFHLPLKTKLDVCLGERVRRPVRRVLSCRSHLAEELSEATYNRLVGLEHVEVGYVRPQIRAPIGSIHLVVFIQSFIRYSAKVGGGCFHFLFVCVSVRVCPSRISQKLSTNFDV